MLRGRSAPFVLPASCVLFGFGAAFLALTILSGVGTKDYPAYLIEWDHVIRGDDPWRKLPGADTFAYNTYGPLFNLLAPLIRIDPLANKVFFATGYVGYVIWLTTSVARKNGIVLSSPVIIFILLNPLPWVEIAYGGVFDGLTGISCVAATHCALQNKNRESGLWLALGILLKYMPLAILPFLAFDWRGVRVRLVLWCAAPVALGLLLSYLRWGPSTFSPLVFAVTRSTSTSIYDVLARANLLLDQIESPAQLFRTAPDLSWLAVPCLLVSLLFTFAWCWVHKVTGALPPVMSLLALTLFYWVGFSQYQVALFCSASYWVAIEWRAIQKHRMLINFLVLYFGSVGVMALVTDTHLAHTVARLGDAERMGIAAFSYLLLLLRFGGGIALLAAMMRVSSEREALGISVITA
jgi:Glycosyltransferase family 87